MNELPEPLTPADCDLTNFGYMPLVIGLLKQSKAWLRAKKNPALAFYLVNLWTAAWHQVPAASLEDDDEVLADAAMCDEKTWGRVRDEVLRGWIKCSDGRLYHPFVAKEANDKWGKKQELQKRTAAARQARQQKRNATTDTDTGATTEPVTTSVTKSVTDNATNTVTSLSSRQERRGDEMRGEETLSDPNGSGAKAPPLPLSDQDRLWRDGVPYLAKRGIPDGQARSVIGRWLKGNSAANVLNAIGRAQAEQAVEPISFITACLKPGKQPSSGDGYVPMGPAGG